MHGMEISLYSEDATSFSASLCVGFFSLFFFNMSKIPECPQPARRLGESSALCECCSYSKPPFQHSTALGFSVNILNQQRELVRIWRSQIAFYPHCDNRFCCVHMSLRVSMQSTFCFTLNVQCRYMRMKLQNQNNEWEIVDGCEIVCG